MTNLINEQTGNHIVPSNVQTIIYKLGEYNIAVKVNEKNEFLGIENISVNKIFYDYTSVKAEHDVAKFYED
jgi:hypothetical protein